ncbi:hypothetical protein BaRGS_00014171, partial [Batillaria attramentaria]
AEPCAVKTSVTRSFPTTVSELLVLYCQLFLDAECTIDRGVVARLVRILLTGAAQQSDLPPKKLIVFFTRVFEKIREEKGTALMEHMCGALNTFTKSIAPDARTQVCKLGETILPGVLYLWNNYPSDSLKDDLVQFLQVQMQAHHPAGARTQDLGAFASDWEAWKMQLNRIYDLIYRELDQLGGRQKFTTGLQLLAFMLEKYPGSVLEMDVVAALSCLHQVLTTNKGIISSKQAEADGYQQSGFDLLTTLLHCNLVHPGRQVWNLFLSDVTHPTPHSLSFLTILLSTAQIPENYQPSILGSGFAMEKDMFPLRKHLLEWVMLGLKHPDSGSKVTADSIHTLVSITLQLMMRDPGAEYLAETHCEKLFTTSLEETFLLTTFDCALDFEKQDTVSVGTKLPTSHMIPVMVSAVNDALQEIIHQHLLITEPQVKMVELLACDCCLLSHYLHESRRHSVSVAETEPLLQQVMAKLTSVLEECSKREGTSGLLHVIKYLQGMMSFPGTSDLACFQTAETVRGCTPTRLRDILLDMVSKKLSRGANSTRGQPQQDDMSLPRVYPSGSRGTSNGGHVFHDFGITQDGSGDEGETSMDIEFDDRDAGDSQERDEGHQQSAAGFPSLLDPELLSDSQTLRNSIVHFLCLLINYDCRYAPGEISSSGFDVRSVKMKVEELLSEEMFDPTHPADLQLMDLTVRTLLSPGHHVTDSDLENIIEALRRRQSDGVYKSIVRLRLAQCMASITQYDPQGSWGTLILPQEDEAATVPQKFPYSVIDPSLSVRLFVSTAVKRLFVVEINGKLVPQEKKQQHEAFDLLYDICNDMMDVKGKISVERQRDERLNRTASLLLTLSCAAMASHVCEKKALFAFCQSIREKNVDVTHVEKVLARMAGTLGYPGVSDYLSCHLPFLVSQWLDLRYPLAEFPFQLLHCADDAHFYRNHQRLLVSQQFMHKNMAGVEEIARSLNQGMEETLKGCLPDILVHILPLFAVSKSPQLSGDLGVRRHLATANACYDLLVQQLGQDTIDKSIMSQLGTVVVRIFGCLKLQETGSADDQGENNHESNPPSYCKDMVRMTLDYLTKSFSGNTRSLVTVLAKSPDGIERVLLELCLMLWRERRVHERLRVLQMLRVFVSMLLKELADTQLGGAWAFVLRRMVTTLLHTLTPRCRNLNRWQDFGLPEEIILTSLHVLRKVCVAIIECCHEELGNHLCHIVDVTSQLAVQSGDVGETAMGLLKFLLQDSADQLQGFITSLDPLPDDPAFAELTKLCERVKQKAGRKCMDKMLDQVLRAARDVPGPTDSFARTLACLVDAIDTNRNVFTSLLAHTNGGRKVSHLICELLRLTQSTREAIAKEAGRCLGAIGPVDLRTFSLPGPQASPGLSEALQVYEGGPCEKYCHIFHSLHHYLVDPSVDVVEMASLTLKKLLATPAGIQFSADYKDKLANRDYLFQYLHPFRSSKNTRPLPSSGSGGNLPQFYEHVNTPSVWEAEHAKHGRWVTDVCVALLQSGAVTDPVLALLQPVCEAKVEFCEMLLPYLIHDVLSSGQPEHREVLTHRVNAFFQTHCQLTSAVSATTTEEGQHKSVCVNMDSVRTMLKVVKKQQGTTAWDNNFWLDLNYLNIALAAQNCAAHFSAVLFTEIWCDQQRETIRQPQRYSGSDHRTQSSEKLSQGSLLQSLTSLDSSGDHNTAQALLLEALRCTGDPDAIYGCGAGSLPDAASRVETYLHEKQWEKAVVTLDIQMQHPTLVTQLGLLTAVQRCGMDYLLHTSLEGLERSSVSSLPADLAELQYQAAWRAGQWNLDIPQRMDGTAPLHHSLYSCLHALRDEQPVTALSILNNARCSLLQSFDTHLESCRSLYPLLSKLQCLRKFEIFIAGLSGCGKDKTQETVRGLLKDWQQEQGAATSSTEFEFLEPVQSLQLAVVRLLVTKEHHEDAKQALQDMLLMAARTARTAGHFQLAERHLFELQHQVNTSSAVGLRTQLESAQLFWSRSEHTTAKHILKTLINKCEQASDDDGHARSLLPTALGLYGNWLAETRSETPSIIMEQFLERTVRLLENKGENGGQEAVEGYLSLARFSDTQYQNIVNYMRSPTFEAKQALMNKAAAEYEKYKDVGQPQKDRYLRTLEKQTKIDQEEVAAMARDRERFLLHAVRCYAQCLQHGDTHDLRIFRLMSLWFDNSSVQDVSSIMQECSEKLKSYKFLPLLHQLAARMSTKVKDNQTFFSTLNKILERAALDHPHHTLWVVLALAHANKDEELLAQGRSAKRGGRLATGKQGSLEEEDRVQAARNLLERLKGGSKVAAMVRDMEMLSTAYIQLANWSVEQYRRETKPVSLPKSLQLMSLKELPLVCVPSLEVPVDPSGCYDSIVFVRGFQPTFCLAGGVNLPKIIACRCSDGIDRRQLVKGRDDLRQDAIMQQVFSLVNRLLLSDAQASRRQLHIRTYKVVPLSQRSGLLEWCEGTQPIGEYLVGNPGNKGSGAHARYRPKDWGYLDCRKRMMSVQNDADQKYSVYMEVCKNFEPVFRFFFMEKFLDPAVWFQRRLSYTRSVATNSIVGYILGLGDRHVMNILIDCNSAELIHIDLGVAFEQGHILPTPETVPFRLTRDIVDGMGVTGVEGVFRRCCEKTMEVMRGHKESLLTIVQVLLHDPLSEWTLSPHKVYALQARRDRRDCDTADISATMNTAETDLDMDGGKSDRSQEPVNKLAERVLLRLQQKLQGLEDGVTLSVAGQVNHLIQTARDPHNLSHLFPGWQPYI